MKYKTYWLNILQKNAYYNEDYAQSLGVYRKLWESERIALLERIPRRKRKTLK